MKISDRKIIIVFLIVIIVLSIILLYKVNRTPQYNEQLYSEVYAEYNKILENIDDIEDIENIEEKDRIQIGISDNIESIGTINGDKVNNRNEDRVIALIRISKINIVYPVIANTTMENLKVAPTRLAGGEPNEVGNFCIIGHNMRNQEQFSNLKKLKKNDTVEILNTDGTKVKYSIYDSYTVNENDLSCTSQNTNGKREVTLITCTNNKKKRLVVKCREV